MIEGDASTPRVVSACDIGAATAALSDIYNAVTVRVARDEPRLRMRLQSSALRGATLAALKISTSSILTEPYPFYTVVLPGRGQMRLSTSAASASLSPGQGAVLAPGKPVQADYLGDDCDLVTAVFEPRALERELSIILGRQVRSPIRFAFSFDQSLKNTPFCRALSMLSTELASPVGLGSNPLMSVHLARLVMTGLLLSQPHNFSDDLHVTSGFQGPRTIKAAVAAIEERPTEIITVADIARVAHLSVRALEDGFRRHVGVSPMKYLRQVRMARAHDELLAADPDSTTASVVAQSWRFAHYGRFSAEYHERFGCTPSDTLRRI